jgi:hypothetical protein
MSTRNISWDKSGQCVGLTTLPLTCADCLTNLGASTSWNAQGLSRPVIGLLYLFTLILTSLVLITFISNDIFDLVYPRVLLASFVKKRTYTDTQCESLLPFTCKNRIYYRALCPLDKFHQNIDSFLCHSVTLL